MPRLLLVVEGHGDVESAPILTRRVLHERLGNYVWELDTHRRGGLSHLRANHWSHFRRYLGAAFNEECPIVWLIDCEDDCAWHIAAEMSAVACEEVVRSPLAVCCWVREYETMFLIDIDTTRQELGFPANVEGPDNPESVRGAKEWLSRQLPRGRRYRQRIEQPRLSANISIDRLAREYRSFQHFAAVLGWITAQVEPSVYPIRNVV